MPIKSEKMKISKNKKLRFFLMSQGSLNPKIRFLVEKVCPVACLQTDRQTDRQTDGVTTVGTLSGFQDFSFNLSSRIGPKKNIFSYSDVKLINIYSLLWHMRLLILFLNRFKMVTQSVNIMLAVFQWKLILFSARVCLALKT